MYCSCLTQLNLDRHNRISTTDTRLIRRIIRDAGTRGYSAQETIGRWESVRRGEKRHIFPYQENADEMFNSALVYELSGLKPCGRTAAAPGAIWHAGIHRSQAPAGFSGMVLSPSDKI